MFWPFIVPSFWLVTAGLVPAIHVFRPPQVVNARHRAGHDDTFTSFDNARHHAGTEMIMPGDNAAMDVELITPIAMEEKQRFAIREGGKTVGAGVVVTITE